MKRLSDLEYLRLTKINKFLYKIVSFFIAIPIWFLNLGKKLWNFIKKVGIGIKDFFVGLVMTFVKGSWKTKVSYVIMGFGNIVRGQILRGLLFLAFQGVFIYYMITTGTYWLGKFETLGEISKKDLEVYDPILDVFYVDPSKQADDSFRILLYGLLTIIFIVALVVTWYYNVKQNRISDEIERSGKKIRSNKDDLKSLVDDQFHKTLLSLPLLGIFVFTVIPIIFMILVAFTNYGTTEGVLHDGQANLFTWVGLENFNQLFSVEVGDSNLRFAFGEILTWTLIWAFFATFTNYFLGMLVAMMINKKGIRLKKLWRTVLVISIAVPQFISLMYVARLFANNGLVNSYLKEWGVTSYESGGIKFWTDPTLARIMVIVINIWVGIPYLMLITTGVLMNIPADLYESSKIDGANTFQQYTKITLPYMLFVTGPYLLTNFIGNINNFNVIYLLTTNGGTVSDPKLQVGGISASPVDLLVTWLFNITMNAEQQYKLASVIGIMIFVVVAVLSLIVYNVMPSTKNEEDYA